MMASEKLFKEGMDLDIILEMSQNFLKNDGKQIKKSPLYYACSGNLLLILKHQQELKLKKIEDLSIPDLERMVNIMSYVKIKDKLLEEKINFFLDKKFQKICGKCLSVKIEYENIYWFDPYRFSPCNSEIVFHYIVAKKKLNKLGQLKDDKKLAFLLRKTYDSEKSAWFAEKYLRPTQNKWVHFIAAISELDILVQREKETIIKHNAELKIDKKQLLLAQFWNRIWMFRALGIKNIEELKSVFPQERDFKKTKNNICGPIPKISDFKKEDIFKEGIALMHYKYDSIKRFCNAN